MKTAIWALAVMMGGALGTAFVNFNGWAWELDALAAEQSGLAFQLVIKREAEASERLYDLERAREADPDGWNERDEKRLVHVEKELEAAERDLEEFIEQDTD